VREKVKQKKTENNSKFKNPKPEDHVQTNHPWNLKTHHQPINSSSLFPINSIFQNHALFIFIFSSLKVENRLWNLNLDS